MKRALSLFLLFLFFTTLIATPSYMGTARSTAAYPLSIQAMDLYDGHLFIADKSRNQVLSLEFPGEEPYLSFGQQKPEYLRIR